MAVVPNAVTIEGTDGSFIGTGLGPYAFGGNLFAVQPWSGFGSPVKVFKSADSGATWAEVDAANRPDKATQCTACRSGDVLTIAYIKPTTSELAVITFDLSAETYGTQELSGITPAGDATDVVACASGFLLVVTNTPDTYVQRLAGVWSQITYASVAGGQTAYIGGCALDPGDDIHLIYIFDDPSLGTRDPYHVRLQNDGTLGAAQLLSGPTSQPHTLGRGAVVGTHIVMPVTYQQNDFSSEALYAFVSNVYASDAPTWSTELVDSQKNNGEWGVAFADGATATLFYLGFDDGSTSTNIMYYATTDGSGTWASRVAFFDADAGVRLGFISAAKIDTGVYGAVCLMTVPALDPLDPPTKIFVSAIDSGTPPPAPVVMNYIWSS